MEKIIQLKLLLQLGMNGEHLLRLSQIKNYVNTLNDTITVSDHLQALTMMSKFKKAVLKQDVNQHSNQFVLDCLRAKNEKLRTEIEQVELEKRQIESKLTFSGQCNRSMQEVQVGIFLSRLPITLSDYKKVDYDQVTIASDYNKILIKSIVSTKYKDYNFAIESVVGLDNKNNHVYLNIQQKQNFHMLIRFNNDKEAHRWTICLKFGQVAIKTKSGTRLFQTQNQKEPSHFQKISQSAYNQTSNLTPQMPFLSKNEQGKSASPPQSMISERKSGDKSGDRSFGDRSMQKNTEKSLVNALSFEGRDKDILSFNQREVSPQINTSKRIDLSRPPNITRVRGRSQNIDNSFQISKIYKSNPRKQSEDIFKPHINQTYHQKMLQYRNQERSDQDIKSQSTFKHPTRNELSVDNSQKSARIKFLEDKKKELLKQSQSTSIEKPSFGFESKVSWADIEEMDDQNKSKSSIKISNKSRKGSVEFSDTFLRSSDNAKKEIDEERSEHISQKSQEQSPKLPERVSYEVPHKISYANGIVFRLNPVIDKVGNSSLSPKEPNLADTQNRAFEKSENSNSDTSSSMSETEEHNDPSSHENHTESEDNTARAEELKKGIILTKCSENGFWTHQKILYLSENENEVCSRDVKDKKIKKIKLGSISSVDYKKFDQGIIKHISKIEEDKCMVIRAVAEDGKIKNYEFVGNLAEPLERFAANLKQFIEYTLKNE